MYAWVAAGLWILGCAGGHGDEVVVAPPDPCGSDWVAAFPLGDGEAMVECGSPGRLLTPKGTEPIEVLGACGSGHRVVAGGLALLGLPPGQPISPLRPPANSAALVERAAWRLAEVLGPEQGLRPGGAQAADPALFEGIRVRTVRKTRRMGPPVLVVVGDRRGRIASAIMDREAERVIDSDLLDTGAVGWTEVGATSAADLDGDGQQEVAVWARGEGGAALRVVYRVDLGPEPALDRIWTRQVDRVSCD